MRRAPKLAGLVFAAAAALVVSACSPVRHATTHRDYAARFQRSILRLAVVSSPLPLEDEALGAMWSSMARRYTNHHRDFIVKREVASDRVPPDICAADLDGVLYLTPSLEIAEEEVEVTAHGRLARCRDDLELWSAEVSGTWPKDDPNVATVIEEYQEEHGASLVGLVAPTFHALRALLETLPRPVLERDEDIMEKIELGE